MKPVTRALRVLTPLLMFSCSSGSFADWNGGIEAGTTLGSDERPTLRLYAQNQSDPLSHYAYLDWIRSSGGSSYRIGYNPTFSVSHSVYSFGRFSLEKDDPSGVSREIDGLIGIGNNLIQRGNTRLKVEAGLGARQLTFDDGSSDTEDGFLFVSGNLVSSMLAILQFDAGINTKVGSERVTYNGEAGISLPIGPGTALRYVYTVRHDEVDGGDDITSEDSAFRITYGF